MQVAITASRSSFFGPEVDCRLGLFHFMHRMVDTLDFKSGEFFQCMYDVRSMRHFKIKFLST